MVPSTICFADALGSTTYVVEGLDVILINFNGIYHVLFYQCPGQHHNQSSKHHDGSSHEQRHVDQRVSLYVFPELARSA
jgi:hypothetical protein